MSGWHVLVCLDRSPLGERVLPHALALARSSSGGQVTLLHVLEADHHAGAVPTDPLAWEIRSAEAQQYLEALAARRRSEKLPIAPVLIQGHAAEQIRDWAATHHVDFTVLSTHGEGGRSEWRLASTTHKLIEGVASSVLLVPADVPPAAGPELSYARVLVPVDGSALAESVLPVAIRIARAHAAELIVAHVVPVPELTRIGPLTSDDLELEQRVLRRNEAVGRAYLDRLRARAAASAVRVRSVLSHGSDVRGELLRIVAHEHVDLVVLSAHGRSGRIAEPCGSVAADLLAHCTIPVLVIRERQRVAGARRLDASAARRRASVRMPALAGP
jgi:nucleotide-binding universal stress UspA family protein